VLRRAQLINTGVYRTDILVLPEPEWLTFLPGTVTIIANTLLSSQIERLEFPRHNQETEAFHARSQRDQPEISSILSADT